LVRVRRTRLEGRSAELIVKLPLFVIRDNRIRRRDLLKRSSACLSSAVAVRMQLLGELGMLSDLLGLVSRHPQNLVEIASAIFEKHNHLRTSFNAKHRGRQASQAFFSE
jgi:hypothetical protein